MNIIILAGGSGTRLWPESRESTPKQFLRLFGEKSLLQQTIERFLLGFSISDLLIVTQEDLLPLTLQQLAEIEPTLRERVVVEPERKNTMPALLFALDWLKSKGELQERFLIAPSDHLISPAPLFLEKLKEASAIQGHHVLFGVVPTVPHTGYGYIEASGNDVLRFIEKPNVQKAQELLLKENCFWNAGIFLFDTERFLSEWGERETPALSIDHAYLEEARELKVIPLSLSWSDVGSWDGVFLEKESDREGNSLEGSVEQIGSKGCMVLGKKRHIGLIDVEDLIVVDSDDALLIAKKGSTQKVRSLSKTLEEKRVVRPWGEYTVLEEGEGYKIKRIEVTPSEKLSLQYHRHRSEHWVVIRGRAKIQLGEDEVFLGENESLFVPKEMPHRLENPTEEPLEIIEVQVGDYVGEDDIIRLSDIYGRHETARDASLPLSST